METMQISKFKAKAIGVLKRVNATGLPVSITLRGKPIAEIQAPSSVRDGRILLGTGKGLITKQPSGEDLVMLDFGNEWEPGS